MAKYNELASLRKRSGSTVRSARVRTAPLSVKRPAASCASCVSWPERSSRSRRVASSDMGSAIFTM